MPNARTNANMITPKLNIPTKLVVIITNHLFTDKYLKNGLFFSFSGVSIPCGKLYYKIQKKIIKTSFNHLFFLFLYFNYL